MLDLVRLHWDESDGRVFVGIVWMVLMVQMMMKLTLVVACLDITWLIIIIIIR